MNSKIHIPSFDETSISSISSYFENSSKLFQKAMKGEKLNFPEVLPNPLDASTWPVSNKSQVISDLVHSGIITVRRFEKIKKPSHVNKDENRELDEEVSQLEQLRKKVKVQKEFNRQASTPTTFSHEVSEGESEDHNLDKDLQCSKKNVTYSEIGAHKEEIVGMRKTCTNMSLFYGENKKEIFFRFEYFLEGNPEPKSRVFTREEILKHDPRWILYFYENHLQFVNSPEFSPETMKRV